MISLPLPTTPQVLLTQCIRPALLNVPAKMRDMRAEVQLVTTAMQESGLKHREQMGGGPARSLWQFEKNGGCREVMTNTATAHLAENVCDLLGVAFDLTTVFAVITTNDELAACWARLNYWRSPLALPALGDAEAAWKLYKAVWAPGMPRKETWAGYYQTALEVVTKST